MRQMNPNLTALTHGAVKVYSRVRHIRRTAIVKSHLDLYISNVTNEIIYLSLRHPVFGLFHEPSKHVLSPRRRDNNHVIFVNWTFSQSERDIKPGNGEPQISEVNARRQHASVFMLTTLAPTNPIDLMARLQRYS
jgi:hypothetical protein